MATLILSTIGKTLGGIAGAGAAAVGQFAGALIGREIDRAIFGAPPAATGPRLAPVDIQSAAEGRDIARIYGRVRIAGQMIWATRLKETVNRERVGGKGGSGEIRTYLYSGNFAFALCEGPVTGIGRIWADGHLLDQSELTMRVHLGSADQLPDPLIASRQAQTPAYRGIAYVVFEEFALAPFGNRIPQFHFEVIRSVDRLERMVRAVTLIPGSGEFVYGNRTVIRHDGQGRSASVNRHVTRAATNWAASIDDLTALCPALESVGLVAAWFADDLRCGHARIRPKVEHRDVTTIGATWSVAGLARDQAELVSYINKRPAYGGTPSDDTIIDAIRDLKSRRLRVVLYPFILMDIPPDNQLPDPYGGAAQSAYPWRGRITNSGQDQAAAAANITRFVGAAGRSHFRTDGETIAYGGPDEWSYRRFILHFAHLARAAGGVDGILIGSEMRGLTHWSGGAGSYPFVTALCGLARDVKSIVGDSCIVSYAADWSEYGHLVPAPGALHFPLDPLWASDSIDVVGIDNYLPISDVRDFGQEDSARQYDIAHLREGIAGGEYHDWYYRTAADRRTRTRSPITDSTAQKPHVYRAKDLKNWWSNRHYERANDVESTTPTPWQARSKPIWFTELGIPAADKGANQPNVFFDPKSSESALPHFSTGNRDDFHQRRALEALLSYWGANHPVVASGDNPVSDVYHGPMVDPANIHLWCWDARPYPEFPALGDVWSDGGNWRIGHWLNGRLSAPGLDAVCRQVIADMGIDPQLVAIEDVAASIEGYVISANISARAALAPLLDVFGAIAVDTGEKIVLRAAQRPATLALNDADLVLPQPPGQILSATRTPDSQMPAELRMHARDAQADFRPFSVSVRREHQQGRQLSFPDMQLVLDREQLARMAQLRLARHWTEREDIAFVLSPTRLDIETGDIVRFRASRLPAGLAQGRYRITAIEEHGERRVQARRTGRALATVRRPGAEAPPPRAAMRVSGPAEIVIFDRPALPGGEDRPGALIGVFAAPWPGGFDVYRLVEGGRAQRVTTMTRLSTIGRLRQELAPGKPATIDRIAGIEVELLTGELESLPERSVLAGGNALALISAGKRPEIIQFLSADLVAPRRYLLSGLIRGIRGTERAAMRPTPAGARLVLLDGSLTLLPALVDEIGLTRNFRIVPAGQPPNAPTARPAAHHVEALALRPFAPTHPNLWRNTGSGDVTIDWRVRARTGGDSWIAPDSAFAEPGMSFRIEFLAPSGAVQTTFEASAPPFTLRAAQLPPSLRQSQTAVRIRILPKSAIVGAGDPFEGIVNVRSRP